MTIEWSEGKAIYLQIMDHIIKEIAAGKLKPGQRMLSVREYAADFGVNPNTMQRALHELEREGILFSSRNTGRFVTENLKKIQDMKAQHAEEAVQEFCNKMKELGYTGQEAEAFFREKVKEIFDQRTSIAG